MSAAVAGGSPESRRRRGRGVDAAGPDEDARVKAEPDVDIKDYAETTMNELLGWYGYDKLDTRGLNLKNLNHHFPTTSSSSSSPPRHDDDLSEEDTGRSRSPHLDGESVTPNSSGGTIICAWCLKSGLKLFTLKTSSGETKVFCSEPCFNQCRRAAFKKNRVCNWCRHVRHTVNYVDFQDGDDQLQFCSDKCLNQYKMQIFCKETQAYLQMNPHLQEESNKNTTGGSSKLITPDLWLRDCQESLNGRGSISLPHSDDELTPPNISIGSGKRGNGEELEDLSLSKQERQNSVGCNPSPMQEREGLQETGKNTDASIKDKLSSDMCNTLASYLREDKDKSIQDRKKRHENEREHIRKRQRISSSRNRIAHHQEAPPAHLSSTAHSMPFQNQSRVFQSSTSPYPPPLNASSPTPLNPPAAHSNSLPPHPTLTAPLLPPGLPPPPPLLNNDFLHSSFNSSIFPPLNSLSQQQQLDAILRMQSGLRHNTPFPPHLLHESMLPFLRSTPHHSTPPFLQPNTVMLPYPVFVPLPVPIPIPIPLSGFLTKEQKLAAEKSQEHPTTSDKKECIPVDSDKDSQMSPLSSRTLNSRNDSTEVALSNTKGEKQAQTAVGSSYAVTNNNSQTHRLILTRNKM